MRHCAAQPLQRPTELTTSFFFSPPGDRIIVVVQKQRSFGPEAGPGGSVSVAAANKVRRGDIRHAVVVRTHKKYQRPDGSVVRFDDNACVLINKAGEPIGTRLNGMQTLPLSSRCCGGHDMVGMEHHKERGGCD